jgi:hypothetical protein
MKVKVLISKIMGKGNTVVLHSYEADASVAPLVGDEILFGGDFYEVAGRVWRRFDSERPEVELRVYRLAE